MAGGNGVGGSMWEYPMCRPQYGSKFLKMDQKPLTRETETETQGRIEIQGREAVRGANYRTDARMAAHAAAG